MCNSKVSNTVSIGRYWLVFTSPVANWGEELVILPNRLPGRNFFNFFLTTVRDHAIFFLFFGSQALSFFHAFSPAHILCTHSLTHIFSHNLPLPPPPLLGCVAVMVSSIPQHHVHHLGSSFLVSSPSFLHLLRFIFCLRLCPLLSATLSL